MSNNQQIFEDWLAGEISDSACRQALANDPVWLSRFETAGNLRQLASQPAPGVAPPLDTLGMFRRQWGQPRAARATFWQQLSIAMSLLAIAISISPLQLQIDSGAVTLRWQTDQSAQYQQLLAKELAGYRLEQQQYLQQQLQLQQQQQRAQLVLLKDYLTETEQKNRRGDMLELVEYLNQQRQADWQYWQDNFQPSQAMLQLNRPYRHSAQPAAQGAVSTDGPN